MFVSVSTWKNSVSTVIGGIEMSQVHSNLQKSIEKYNTDS